MQDLETFREFINSALETIPRDHILPSRFHLEDKRLPLYYNDCYLRFQCRHCKKSWSSHLGHCYIMFKIVRGGRYDYIKRRDQEIEIHYDYYFYRQKCEKCNRWGQSQLPRYEKGRIADNFARFIDKAIRGQTGHAKTSKPSQKVLESHVSKLCQACHLGYCKGNVKYVAAENQEEGKRESAVFEKSDSSEARRLGEQANSFMNLSSLEVKYREK